MSFKEHNYVSFSDQVVYRGLETPHIFHIARDELYELDEDGLAFVEQVDGTHKSSAITNRELIEFCDQEELLIYSSTPSPRKLVRGQSPIPSLRYLELQITGRCNLSCRHCYLGPASQKDMGLKEIVKIIEELDRMQGIRLMLSGGEPLMHPGFWELNDRLSGYGFRIVLLTNGISLDKAAASRLSLHEVQVSIDGMASGHDSLRGKGTFKKAVSAAAAVTEVGLDLSIATMAHARNLDQMEELSGLVQELGAREWSIDVPCIAGRMTGSDELAVTPQEGARAMSYGFGGSYHGSGEGYAGSGEGYACGRHLLTVMPDGKAAQCGFYAEAPLGHVSEGLAECWSRRRHIRLMELECKGCEHLEECAGGCRFRAGGFAKDPVMCALFGVQD